jgi:hypothetical protein
MKSKGTIVVSAEHFAEALGAVVPMRRQNSRKKLKPHPISLVYFRKENALGIVEAYHELKGYRIAEARYDEFFV